MKKILLILIVFLILAAGSFAYYKYSKKQKVERYQNSFESGQKLFYSGDPKSSLRFEDAVKNASTKNEEALAKVNLGISLLQQDPIKGVNLLKEVSLDTTMPNFYRAGAINYTLSYYFREKDVDFAQKYIFIGNQWQSFLTSEGASDRERVELAIRKGFEWSSDIFSTFVAEYRIAWWYSKQIRAELATSTDAVNNYASIINERLARGDIAFASAVSVGETSRSQIGLAYILKGLALEGLYKINKTKKDDVRAAYERAIQTLDADPNNFWAQVQVLYARYHLAAFLARMPKPDTNEIILVLEPIYKIIDAPFYQFLQEERDIAVFGTDPVRKDIINLAKIDPKFNERLISLGWRESDFK